MGVGQFEIVSACDDGRNGGNGESGGLEKFKPGLLSPQAGLFGAGEARSW